MKIDLIVGERMSFIFWDSIKSFTGNCHSGRISFPSQWNWKTFSYTKLLRRNDGRAMAAKCMLLNINEVSSLNGLIVFQFQFVAVKVSPPLFVLAPSPFCIVSRRRCPPFWLRVCGSFPSHLGQVVARFHWVALGNWCDRTTDHRFSLSGCMENQQIRKECNKYVFSFQAFRLFFGTQQRKLRKVC